MANNQVKFIAMISWILNFKLHVVTSEEWIPTEFNVDSVEKDMCTVDKQLTVKFEGKEIRCGKYYNDIGRFATRPKVTLDRANVHQLYTFIMFDPDAPNSNHPTERNWLHWLIVNIEDADLNEGFEVTEYNPPTPPAGSGPHRYVFLLLKQQEKEIEYLPYENRGKFDINQYAKDHKLIGISGFTYFETETK